MLDQQEFDNWASHCKLSDRTKREIERIRSSPPARSVQSRGKNVTGKFNRSHKMAHSIQYESRTVELSAILIMEFDDDVLEIWDQPSHFVVNYQDAAGKNRGYTYTPDFFIIRRNGAGWEEWKTEEQLVKLVAKSPNRYSRDDNSQWSFPPGDRYAEDFGLYFNVHSSAEINLVKLKNFKLLHPYFNSSEPCIRNLDIQNAILSIAADEPGITMANLLARVEEASNSDIFSLIFLKQIYVDLGQAWLGDEHKVQIYCNNNEAIEISKFLNEIHKQTIELCLPIYINKHLSSDITHGLHTKEEITEAMRRWEIIKPALRGESIIDSTVTRRTHRNWLASFKQEAKNGNGLLGLIPKHRDKGNTEDRLALIDERIRPLMNEFINDVYETPVQKTKSLAYGEFVLRCEKLDISPPSFKAFNLAIKRRAGAAQIAKMEGSKVAYQHEEFMSPMEVDLPANGDRPWEIAHIDHVELKVELVHSSKPTLMGKAWLTLIIDSFSRRVLAYYLTFDSPSYRSCMGAMRECVRKHNRLPESLFSDNGKEFHSIYFEKLSARYQCNVQWRPPSKPRFGAIIERFIHTVNEQFIHNLKGNTKIMKKARQVTTEVNPKNHAVWTLPMLDESIENYFYEEYDTRLHFGIGCTPREEFQRGLDLFKLPEPYIDYDEYFLIDTLPSARTKDGKAKVVPYRGIKIKGIFYNSPELRKKELHEKRLPVRYDPFNLAIAYALIGKKWAHCYAPPYIYAKLKDCTEREMKIFSEEQRQLNRVYGRNFKSRVKSLAENHALREDSERAQEQRLRDGELKIVRERNKEPLNANQVVIDSTTNGFDENNKINNSINDSFDLSNLVSFQRAKRGAK